MVMAMLAAGGVPVLADDHRPADRHNPGGYYEHIKARAIREHAAWLGEARGKALKVISFHLFDLPREFHYNILFVERAMPEILASQRAMLPNLDAQDDWADTRWAERYQQHLAHVKAWLATQSNIRTLFLQHHKVLGDTHESARAINAFLGDGLAVPPMADAVRQDLHRNKQPAALKLEAPPPPF